MAESNAKPDKKALDEWWKQIEEWRSVNCLKYETEGGKIKPQFVIEKLYEVDRKSTRLNSSHTVISYAVFCLKKKNKKKNKKNTTITNTRSISEHQKQTNK